MAEKGVVERDGGVEAARRWVERGKGGGEGAVGRAEVVSLEFRWDRMREEIDGGNEAH